MTMKGPPTEEDILKLGKSHSMQNIGNLEYVFHVADKVTGPGYCIINFWDRKVRDRKVLG